MNNPDDQDYETWSLDVWLPEDIEQLLRSRDQRCAEIDRLRAELAEQRRELKVTQAGWLIEINKVARVQEYVETEMNFYAHDDNAAYRILRLLGRHES